MGTKTNPKAAPPTPVLLIACLVISGMCDLGSTTLTCSSEYVAQEAASLTIPASDDATVANNYPGTAMRSSVNGYNQFFCGLLAFMS
ncbi:MAG TPA: hypothetical protein VMX13_18715 [Sedimentisphaerales bacterium]|nr:hypothetical protein [Sedimentisphaerales bacterium]